jgi:hypothetical protein
MTTQTSHNSHAKALLLAVAAMLLASLTVSAGVDAVPADAAPSTPAGYAWPVKPFDRAHPVRANFGDPRTTFTGTPTAIGLRGTGNFGYHFGIDISVPDGTAVYPVRSGTASVFGGHNIAVDSGAFGTQYWHLVPAVHTGQRVIAFKTILGRVQKGFEHVHFAESTSGGWVNPLAAGHLTPCTDATSPSVQRITFRADDATPDLLPEFVHGRVSIVAEASDLPSLSVPGLWHGLPVAPARITWRIDRARDGKVVVPTRTAFDVTTSLPDPTTFWSHYARGTRQNFSTFGVQRAWRLPGTYLFRLAPSGFETRSLANGIYDVVVTAQDVAGNEGSAHQVFIVRNAARV